MKAGNVFPHNGYPEITYVERETGELEDRLEGALTAPGAIISVSGPTKTGKSMLVHRVARKSHIEQMAVVSGNINSESDLWKEALNNLGEPTATENLSSEINESGSTVKGGVDFGVSVGGDSYKSTSEENAKVKIDERRGLSKLVELVDTDKFVLFIDDFHYIDEDIKPEISEAIKIAAERGIKICVAMVSYRSEDLEKVNDDLAMRVYNLDIDSWSDEDLKEIADIGFDYLGIDISNSFLNTLIEESAGSPQIMQLLCFSTCTTYNIWQPQEEEQRIDPDEEDKNDIFREAIRWGGYSSVVETIYEGAITRGGGRQEYQLKGSPNKKGDYYECCLRAIAKDPPEFTFHRNVLYERVKEVCSDRHPQSNQVLEFCKQMNKLSKDERPNRKLVDWDGENDTLLISEPGLLFNIRWAMRLGIHTTD